MCPNLAYEFHGVSSLPKYGIRVLQGGAEFFDHGTYFTLANGSESIRVQQVSRSMSLQQVVLKFNEKIVGLKLLKFYLR